MRRLGWVVLAAAVLAAGCGSDDDDDAGGSAPPGAASTTAPARATTVTNPRDASVLVTNPCAAFTAEQLAPFGIVKPGELTEKPSAGSPELCRWPRLDLFNNQGAFVSLERRIPDPQSAVDYLDSGNDNRVERVVIAGNPATLNQQLVPDRACTVKVLVAPTEMLIVDYEQHRDATSDPCVATRELAEIAVGNLPPLS